MIDYCSDHDDLPGSAPIVKRFPGSGLAGGFWSGGSGGPSERRALPYPVQRWEPWCHGTPIGCSLWCIGCTIGKP